MNLSNEMIQEQWIVAQQTVLGSILIDAKCANDVLARTKVHDYTGVYREMYLVIQELIQSGEEPDPILILNKMGGQEGSPRKLIAELIDLTPTSANCKLYTNILIEQSKLYQVRQLGMNLCNCLTLKDAETATTAISEAISVRSNQQVFGMQELLERFYERHTSKQPVKYLQWGISKLDMRLYAEQGDFIILGGYPSDGKTALALSFSWHQSQTMKVGFFSLETSKDKVFDRLGAMITGIPMGRTKHNQMDDADWGKVAASSRDICGRQLDIIPAAGLSAREVLNLAKAREYQVIYIDYIQLLQPENPKAPRYEKVSQISMDLHTMANQYGIAVIGLSQLSRPEKGQAKKEPRMSDLRESGQLEQDADIILLLYRPHTEDSDGSRPERFLKIAKNKEGQAFLNIALDFDGSTQRFSLSAAPQKPLRKQIAEAREELSYQAQQMKLLSGPDEELPFQ